jgi:hypothetical protein
MPAKEIATPRSWTLLNCCGERRILEANAYSPFCVQLPTFQQLTFRRETRTDSVAKVQQGGLESDDLRSHARLRDMGS